MPWTTVESHSRFILTLYLSALYPLCLIVVAYALIELHARNCQILVWLWKPLCFICVRFWQSWRAKTSVVDAFAAFILLSYVKIVRISLLLTTFTYIYNTNSTAVKKVVSWVSSRKFFQGGKFSPYNKRWA